MSRNHEAAYELAVQFVEAETKQPSVATTLLAGLTGSGLSPSDFARRNAVDFIGSIIANNIASGFAPAKRLP
jgi:hypothetical protein